LKAELSRHRREGGMVRSIPGRRDGHGIEGKKHSRLGKKDKQVVFITWQEI
jgi:hypothetical protein